jgi:hypothetical protein
MGEELHVHTDWEINTDILLALSRGRILEMGTKHRSILHTTRVYLRSSQGLTTVPAFALMDSRWRVR